MAALHQDCELILASTSFIRKDVLHKAGLAFQAIAPDFDEEEAKKNLQHLSLRRIATELSCGKALSISKQFPNAYVIGSDQVCDLYGTVISKSKNASEAVLQLTKLNGKTHHQNNAVVVAHHGKVVFRSFSKAKLTMREMSESEIAAYVELDSPWGCAGSYKFESFGKHLFSKVSGDYYAILGFHIQPLLHFLHTRNLISIQS